MEKTITRIAREKAREFHLDPDRGIGPRFVGMLVGLMRCMRLDLTSITPEQAQLEIDFRRDMIEKLESQGIYSTHAAILFLIEEIRAEMTRFIEVLGDNPSPMPTLDNNEKET